MKPVIAHVLELRPGSTRHRALVGLTPVENSQRFGRKAHDRFADPRLGGRGCLHSSAT